MVIGLLGSLLHTELLGQVSPNKKRGGNVKKKKKFEYEYEYVGCDRSLTDSHVLMITLRRPADDTP